MVEGSKTICGIQPQSAVFVEARPPVPILCPRSLLCPRQRFSETRSSDGAAAVTTRLVLTDRDLRALRESVHACDVHDTRQRGLIARVLPSGIVQFSVRSCYQGTQRRLKLGEYPAVSLQLTRKRARNAPGSIDDDGRDPAGERRAAKAARTDTIGALAENDLKKHARSANDQRARTNES